MSNSSIWPIDRTLSGATILGQIRPASEGNEGVLCITGGVSSSDCLVSYPGHLLKVSYPSEEMQLVYSRAPANCLLSQTQDHLAQSAGAVEYTDCFSAEE